MLKIELRFEFHAYAEGRIRDKELLPPDYGLNGPDIILPILSKSVLVLEYDEKTSLGEVDSRINKYLEKDLPDELYPGYYSFYVNNTEYLVDNPDSNFETVLKRWLDPKNSGTIRVIGWICCSAGEYCRDNELRFYFHSHEQGSHKSPHVHVETLNTEESVSISLTDCDTVFAGEMKGKLLKKAKKYIRKNQIKLLSAWNALTDGLRVDLESYMK